MNKALPFFSLPVALAIIGIAQIPINAASLTIPVQGETLEVNFLGNSSYQTAYADNLPYFMGDLNGAFSAIQSLIQTLETAPKPGYFKFYIPVADPEHPLSQNPYFSQSDYVFVGFIFAEGFVGQWLLSLSAKNKPVSPPSLAPWSTWVQFSPVSPSVTSLLAVNPLNISYFNSIEELNHFQASKSVPEPNLIMGFGLIAGLLVAQSLFKPYKMN